MSGRKQHYIPQALLRGFRIPGRAGKPSVYVFRRTTSYISPTDDAGAQRDFYSSPAIDDAPTLDDRITTFENELAGDLRALTAAGSGTVDAETAARVVAHLFSRTQHLRTIFGTFTTRMADYIDELFGTREAVAASLGINDVEPNQTFRDAFAKAIEGEPWVGALGLPDAVIERLSFVMAREAEAEVHKAVAPHIADIIGTLRDPKASLAGNAQRRALAESLVPEGRLAILGALEWQVVPAAGGAAFVLPDCVALAITTTGERHPLVAVSKDELAGILMPLTPQLMLVGGRKALHLDLEKFNRDAAGASLDFFISDRTSESLSQLARTIGIAATKEIGRQLDSAIEEVRPPRVGIVLERQSSEPPSQLTTFSLTLPAELTDDAVERLTSVTSELVHMMNQRVPIDQLKGIVFASDYEATLAAIDRGDADGPPPVPSDQGYSLAYNVDVEHDGIAQVVMVVRHEIAGWLLADDEETVSRGVGILLGQLARIGNRALTAEVQGAGLDTLSGLDTDLLPTAVDIWTAYFVQTYTSIGWPELDDDYQEELIAALDAAGETVVAARRSYRLAGDLDALLASARAHVAAILIAAARVAARGGIGDALDRRLEAANLKRWFELFADDLANLHARVGSWSDLRPFLVLNRHIERLLFTLGIFMWEPKPGELRAEVPLFTDLEYLATLGGPS